MGMKFNPFTGTFDFSGGSSSGGTAWGDITGTLSDQTDLQTALDAKQNVLTGLTATVTELNYTDGVTSAIQTQLDGKFTLQAANVVNESGADVDQRIEGDTDANLLYIDAGADRVGIGNAAPNQKLEVTGSVLVTSSDGDAMIGAQAFPNKVSTTDSVGYGFQESGWGSYKRGMFTEVNGQILSYGINVSQQGDRDTSVIGGIFRLDTRSASSPYFSVQRQIIGGSTAAFDLQITPSGRVILGTTSESFASATTNTIVGYASASGSKILTLIGASGQTADQVEYQINGTVVGNVGANGNLIVNENGADADTRMEGDTDVNLFFLDASTDRLGVGLATPAEKLDVAGNIKTTGNIVLTPSPASDHTFSGPGADLTAGESLVFGDFVYFKSDGKLGKGDADAIATSSVQAMAAATIANDASGRFALPGSFIRDDTWNWTVGGLIYLDTATAGGATQTAPSGTDDVVQILGVATHADRMYFNPQLVQVEVV